MALFLPTSPHFASKASTFVSSPPPPFPVLSSPSLSSSQSRRPWSQKLRGRSARTSSSPTMVFNDYFAGRFPKAAVGGYRSVDSCLVVPPPAGRKPTAIVNFLGGAFIGAVPEVTYSYLMEWLAKEGFLVISVPYSVTFDHERAAREVYERFLSCMDSLLASGVPDAGISPSSLASLPLYSVGHSNGALLQMLVGSYFTEKIPKANAIISFNNRPASEAVPYFEQFGPMVSQVMPVVEASPMYSMARSVSGDAWKSVLEKAGTLIQDYDQGAVASLTKFVDQLPSVMNQVTQGTSEFKPTPAENRQCFKESYSVPHTLLVKFSTDAIDETDVLEDILRPRVDSIGGTLEKITLSGNHLTPCIQDVKWTVGDQYSPADALAQGLKSLSLNDTKGLARTVADWLKGVSHR